MSIGRNAKVWRRPDCSDTMAPMGRGTGHTAAASSELRREALFAATVRRILGSTGDSLQITARGKLGHAAQGQMPGTPYVVITARTAADRDRARQLLASRLGTTDLAWVHGWIPRRLPDGRRVTDLTLYPASSTCPLRAVG
jgi:hypothetical protein